MPGAELNGVVMRANRSPVVDATVTVLNMHTREVLAQLRTDK